MPREVLGLDPGALAVEVVVLLHGGEDLDVVRCYWTLHPFTPVAVDFDGNDENMIPTGRLRTEYGPGWEPTGMREVGPGQGRLL